MPTILVRKEAIIVNILHLRALVKASEVWLFDSASPSSLLQARFLESLTTSLQSPNPGFTSLPYEMRALDAILGSVTTALEEDLGNLRSRTLELLEDLEKNIVATNLRLLLQYSRKLAIFHKRASLVMEAIDEILQQGKSLSSLCGVIETKDCLRRGFGCHVPLCQSHFVTRRRSYGNRNAAGELP